MSAGDKISVELSDAQLRSLALGVVSAEVQKVALNALPAEHPAGYYVINSGGSVRWWTGIEWMDGPGLLRPGWDSYGSEPVRLYTYDQETHIPVRRVTFSDVRAYSATLQADGRMSAAELLESYADALDAEAGS